MRVVLCVVCQVLSLSCAVLCCVVFCCASRVACCALCCRVLWRLAPCAVLLRCLVMCCAFVLSCVSFYDSSSFSAFHFAFHVFACCTVCYGIVYLRASA